MPASRSSRAHGSYGPTPHAAADRERRVRHALLRTLPGRAIVVGSTLKLLVVALDAAGPVQAVASLLPVVDTMAGLAIAAGAAYFLVRLLVLLKRRLLWRVRRKLILSYIFIGVVPACLIVAFFLLCGLLLFYNFSSYLVQSRLQALEERARFLAQSVALEVQRAGGRDAAEIIAGNQADAARDLDGWSVALVPVDRRCNSKFEVSSLKSEDANPRLQTSPQTSDFTLQTSGKPLTAGPWSHVDAPGSVPEWIGCDGLADLFAYAHADDLPAAADPHVHLVVRAVAFPGDRDSPNAGYAVVVDLPVTEAVRQRLRGETGVEVNRVSLIPDGDDAQPLSGLAAAAPEADAVEGSALLSLRSLLEFRDWNTGRSGALLVSTRLSAAELYDRISEAQGLIGRNFGQGLLLILVVIGVLFLILEFVALVAGLALAKSLTGSVHELFTGTELVRQGDYTHRIAVTSDDQLGELARSFNSMTASVENSLREAAEKKRLEEELRIAHDIQISLLPQGPFQMPGLSVTALCVPAREVGGDYYDFLPVDEDRVGVLIADVSGKGTSAALYMAELKGLVLSLSQIHTSPRELLIAANRLLARHLDARSFITIAYAVVDMRTRTMTYARAGHTPLICVPGPSSESTAVRTLTPDGMVLGLKLDEGELFERLLEEETLPLDPGGLYVFFTDGVTEAMNSSDDCFGEGRLMELVSAHAHLPPEELRERVVREVEAFAGGAPQHDDMTMILLKVDAPIPVPVALESLPASVQVARG